MSNPVGQRPGLWVPTVTEEFTGPMTAVDAVEGIYTFSPGGPRWRVWYEGGFHSNNTGRGDVWYDATGVSVVGGKLQLTARPVSTGAGLRFTSGMIQSAPGYTPTYGYAEARMKLPATYGSWPAFWLYSAKSGNSCEFDIMENYGTADQYTIATWQNNTGGTPGGVWNFPVKVATTDWHTYAASWTPEALTFYVDGAPVVRNTNLTDIPAEPMAMILNLQVENFANLADYPATVEVDWVRFYKQAPKPAGYLNGKVVDHMYLGDVEVTPVMVP